MRMDFKLKNLVLIGFSGTGKSTIGEITAKKLGVQFADTDKLIELSENMSISRIFAEFGEKYFRQLEKDVVRECSEKKDMVIATGGGVVLDPQNMANLKSNGFIILLKAKPEIICRNIYEDKNRPLLSDSENLMDRVNEMLKIRADYYKDNHYEIDVSDMTVEQAADEIIKSYNMMG